MNMNVKISVKNLKAGKLATRLNEKADQVLLGLSHSKQSIPLLFRQALDRIENNPSDLVGRVGRSVLERAETVRKQLIEKAESKDARWVPDWLKDVSFVREAAAKSLAKKTSSGEAVEAKPKRASKTPKAGTATTTTKAGAKLNAVKKVRAKKV